MPLEQSFGLRGGKSRHRGCWLRYARRLGWWRGVRQVFKDIDGFTLAVDFLLPVVGGLFFPLLRLVLLIHIGVFANFGLG